LSSRFPNVKKYAIFWKDSTCRGDISLSFIYTLDEETGKFLWKYQTEKGMSHSLPLFADDKVFVGDDSGKIYAINAGNGDLAWKKSLPGAAVIHSSPAFDNGIIFVGTEDSIGPSSRPSSLRTNSLSSARISSIDLPITASVTNDAEALFTAQPWLSKPSTTTLPSSTRPSITMLSPHEGFWSPVVKSYFSRRP